MNWEAFFVIGGFTVILGVVLLIPGLMWARYKSKKSPDSGTSEVVTKSGFLNAGLFVLVILIGMTANIWAPQSSFGQWIGKELNALIFVAGLTIIATIVELVFSAFGFRVIQSKKKNDS